MEAVRILKALGVQPRRTIRVAMWDAEEQGLFGSREYVKNHFFDRVKKEKKPEYDRLSAYFNFDNGSGKIRGIYAQGNLAAAPIFEEWLKPFHDLGAQTVTLRNTGGTDHLSFDGVGLPGFQFIQDDLEYDTLTHHSNMDVYDHISKGDLIQAATIMASFVYNAAMRDEKLPRKYFDPNAPPRGMF
jgi:Zn-dependent M28 family amino/carboxypeptidase